MNATTAYVSSVDNMDSNERAFRTVFGLGMLTTAITAAVASPAILFAMVMSSAYLVLTSILGLDPFYSAWKSVTKS